MQVKREQLEVLLKEAYSTSYVDLTLVCRISSAINDLEDAAKYGRDFWPEFVQFHELVASKWLRKFVQ
jgi:hypothetical protein